MQIHYSRTNGMMVVSIIGRLDTKTTPAFTRFAAGLTPEPVILDLSALEYLSSTGLRALLQLRRDMARNGALVVIAGTNGLVDKVLRVSGFEQVFTLYPAVPDALVAVAGGSA
ncbi:MAG: STAS domain-containing protein [Methanomicrobiales archaeon]|nr:STAS domain-containing protein [Methanomicrobiales archaeon]